jgi:hypothetical protein
MAYLNLVSPRGSLKLRGNSFTKQKISVAISAMLLFVPSGLRAQDAQEGKVSGDYVVTQSIEIGTRMTDVHGNQQTYDSIVNLHSGPRLLEQSLNMRSINHAGSLFDNLWISNFGYGGDPESVSRMRMYKNHWYDFTGSYRHVINFFDYNLLANPLLPANTFVSNSSSPHFMNTRRKMGDFNLTIAPQSPIRLRLGYSRNVNDGPAATTYHEGTEIQLDQNYRNRSDRYSVGVDWKFARKTQLSYDFFFEHNKVDSSYIDANVGNLNANGVPADLGIIYDPFNSQPCANIPTPIVGAGGAIKPVCNQYLHYSRTGPSRASFPTSQISVLSNYFKRLDVSLTGSYSSGQNEIADFNELARAYVSRTNETGFNVTGPSIARRISTSTDLGLTYHLTDRWSVKDQFRFLYWRIPAMWNSSETACYANLPPAGANPATIFTPSGPTTAGETACLGNLLTGDLSIPITATPTVLTASSGGNVTNEDFVHYFGQRTISNSTVLQFDTLRFGAHVGFRYGDRVFTDKDNSTSTTIYYPYNLWTGTALVAQPGATITTGPVGDVGTVVIHEKALLAGVLVRPVDAWRVNADIEYVNNDNAFTRISPTSLFIFRGRTSYRLGAGLNLSGLVNLRQGSNDVSPAGFISSPEQTHRDHSRSYNANLNFTPKEWLALDFGYTFNDLYSNTGTCLPVSTRPSVIPVQGGALDYCYDPTVDTPTPATGDYSVVVRYKEKVNTGYFTLMVKPVKRVTLNIGYDITSNSGSDGFFRADTLAPLLLQQSRVQAGGSATAFVPYNPYVMQGPLAINYHRPSVGASVQVSKEIFLNGNYTYYGYNEKSPETAAGLFNGTTWIGVPPRDFHANTGTVSLRYQF